MTIPPLTPQDAEIIASLDPVAQPIALLHRENALRRGVPHYYFTAGGRDRATQAILRERLGRGAAPAGKSKHEVGFAWDANNWDSRPMPDAAWTIFGEEARKLGLTWGGDFPSRDLGHVEFPQPRTELASFRTLKVLGAAAIVSGLTVLAIRKPR